MAFQLLENNYLCKTFGVFGESRIPSLYHKFLHSLFLNMIINRKSSHCNYLQKKV